MINEIRTPNLTKCATTLDKSIRTVEKITEHRSVTLSDIMDNAINEYLSASSMNILAKIRFHKFLNKSIGYIMKPENFLNSGKESKVYKISDNYVARIKRGKYENNAIHCYDIAQNPNRKFNSLSIYYGEPVVKLGNIEILRNATPNQFTTCGIVWKGKYPTKEAINKYHEEFIPTCAAVPQEGYDEFAKCLKKLNGIRHRNLNPLNKINEHMPENSHNGFGKKISYTLDVINPNNVLISDNSFKLVDSFFKVSSKNPNSVYTMLEPLLIRLTPDKCAEFDAKTAPLKKNIFRKILIASEKAELPLSSPFLDDTTQFGLEQIYRINNNGSKSPLMCLEALDTMRKESVPLKERIAFINKELLEK